MQRTTLPHESVPKLPARRRTPAAVSHGNTTPATYYRRNTTHSEQGRKDVEEPLTPSEPRRWATGRGVQPTPLLPPSRSSTQYGNDVALTVDSHIACVSANDYPGRPDHYLGGPDECYACQFGTASPTRISIANIGGLASASSGQARTSSDFPPSGSSILPVDMRFHDISSLGRLEVVLEFN
nr:hypothetical protein Itr_chr14CG10700 [Ipomoea trifida]